MCVCLFCCSLCALSCLFAVYVYVLLFQSEILWTQHWKKNNVNENKKTKPTLFCIIFGLNWCRVRLCFCVTWCFISTGGWMIIALCDCFTVSVHCPHCIWERLIKDIERNLTINYKENEWSLIITPGGECRAHFANQPLYLYMRCSGPGSHSYFYFWLWLSFRILTLYLNSLLFVRRCLSFVDWCVAERPDSIKRKMTNIFVENKGLAHIQSLTTFRTSKRINSYWWIIK